MPRRFQPRCRLVFPLGPPNPTLAAVLLVAALVARGIALSLLATSRMPTLLPIVETLDGWRSGITASGAEHLLLDLSQLLALWSLLLIALLLVTLLLLLARLIAALLPLLARLVVTLLLRASLIAIRLLLPRLLFFTDLLPMVFALRLDNVLMLGWRLIGASRSTAAAAAVLRLFVARLIPGCTSIAKLLVVQKLFSIRSTPYSDR